MLLVFPAVMGCRPPPATTTASANSTAPATTSVVPQSVKAAEKDCGVQCDVRSFPFRLTVVRTNRSMPQIPVVEPPPKTQRTLPPANVRDEVLSAPPAEKISTASSITIEKTQTTAPTVPKPKVSYPLECAIKPVVFFVKVLGNVTPFSWPKFARAQMDFASKFPDKCRVDASE